MLRYAPSDIEALDIHSKACEGLGDTRSAAESLRSLLVILTARGKFVEAATVIGRLFALVPDSKAAREYFNALSHAQIDLNDVRAIFEHLRVTSPDVHQALQSLALGEIGGALFAVRSLGHLLPDTALPINVPASVGRVVTARLIVSWIDKNNGNAVQGLRVGMSQISVEQRELVSAALHDHTGDASYLRLMTRPSLAGPTVVDASNVAWHGQEMLSSPKPRMGQIVAVRKALRERGYFPIILVGDANLPFVVDEPAIARKMVADHEITLVPSGTDADEYILREAQRLGAPVVTNDYMTEWDPSQNVRKLQYSIAHNTGAASIYS